MITQEKIESTKVTKCVVWKDGTYKFCSDQTWEYEADENWLVTIDLTENEKETDLRLDLGF